MSELPNPLPGATSMEEFARQLAALRQELAETRREVIEVRAVSTRLRALLAEREAELAAARAGIARQAETIQTQAAQIAELTATVVALKERLGIDSNNSGTPPSGEKVWDREKRAEDKKDASPSSRPTLAPPKTKASVRDVPIPAVLARALAEYIDRHKPEDVLFRTARGNLIRRDHFNADVLKPAIFSAGVPVDMTRTALDHAFAAAGGLT
ncbi:hypothetical protein [Microbispora sp. NBC_01389]|uniref:hypothetical protein n=1 Tax=Microbispora sp. NBC_01389 TaxID=2903584 RepID=UPI00324C2113